MATNLEEKLKQLPQKRQVAVEQRAKQLIEEELTLKDLRLALEKTQKDLCKKLHIQQDGISRLEHRSDMLISTLRKYLNAMGGNLKIIAEFPNRNPIQIKGFEHLSHTN